MFTLITRIRGASRSFISYKKHYKVANLRQSATCFHNSPWTNKEDDEKSRELFSDQRFKELVAELETPDSFNQEVDLSEYLETFKPKDSLLDTKRYNQLRNLLNKSFSVRQLSDYLEHKGLNKKGKKERLITRIIYEGWNVKTREQLNEERKRKLQDQVTERFPATNYELFFIIGDNGSTIREVEEAFNVDITIDVIGSYYMVQGPSKSVLKAKSAIRSKLDIIREEVPIPAKIKENPKYEEEVKTILADISKVSNAYISLDGDKFDLACRTTEAVERTRNLLGLALLELDVTDKKPLDTSDTTLLENTSSQSTLLPIHDTSAMSIYSRRFGWSRIVSTKTNDDKDKYDDDSNNNKLHQYNVLSSEESQTVDLDEVKNKLLTPFSDVNNVFIKARFGHLLFRNPDSSNILKPSLDTLLNPSDIKGLLRTRTQFFNAMPPYHISKQFIPFELENGFHERCVRLEYINKSLLSTTALPDLKRVLLEFNVSEQGEMTLKHAFGEKKRSVIDMLGVSGNVDVRLLAKELDHYSHDCLPNGLEEMVDSCKLTSYSELEAPRNWVGQDNTQMTLLDATFVNKKKYQSYNNLVTISHIQQQDSGIERTELDVTSSLDSTNNNGWSSLTNTIYDIASKWKYYSVQDN